MGGYLGTGFTFDANGGITGGTVQVIAQNDGQLDHGFYMTGLSIAATDLLSAAQTVSTVDDYQIFAAEFAGADTFTLSEFGDVVHGYAGNDTINGLGGNDKLDGGAGGSALWRHRYGARCLCLHDPGERPGRGWP